MGTAAVSCWTAAPDDSASAAHRRGGRGDGERAALWVSTRLSGVAQSEAPLRVPLDGNGGASALWTARVAVVKRALLSALEPAARGHDHDPQQTATPTTREEIYLAVVACGRCGRPGGCSCGWRRVHEVPRALEWRSLAQLLPRFLPYAPSVNLSTPQSLHVLLFESPRPPGAWLEASVVSYKIVDPMIERPRAEFKISVLFGDMAWSVSRRFQEFAALHATLSTLFNDQILPPLPPTTWLRKLDDGFLQARRKALDQYLAGLLLIDCVRDSVVMLSFLGAISTAHETLLVPPAGSLCATEVLHLRVLQYYVRAGDLLLFQSRGIVSSLQRSVTGSEWDHVAVVVPRARGDDSKGFLLLEATGDGVTAFSLTTRLYAYSAYHTSRVALRQLHTPLLADAVRSDLLERFSERVKGRPYGLSMSKVLRTNEPRGLEPSRETADEGDLFCSELIADAYKALGLIHETIPSSNFWPSSFASGAFVDAEIGRHGASLGAPIAVDCLMLEVALAKSIT